MTRCPVLILDESRFRAQSRLERHGETWPLYQKIQHDSRRTIGRHPRIVIRADNGGFGERECSLNFSRVARCSALYPPSPFLEKISCLALIIGESCDSRPDPGSDEKARDWKSMTSHERVPGKIATILQIPEHG